MSKEESAIENRQSAITLILASASPRRKELLEGVGLTFDVLCPDVDETSIQGATAEDAARQTAEAKGRWAIDHLDTSHRADATVIAADTIVVMDEHVLGKPRDEEHAKVMLYSLSGREHRVITGVYIAHVSEGAIDNERHIVVSTDVWLKPLSDEQIDAYVASGEPMDKAGAYGIQGGANYMVQRINGSYTNVVGLPLAEVVDVLSGEFGLRWR